MDERIAAAEAYLLRRLERRGRTNDRMMNAVYTMVKQKGIVTAEDLETSSNLSRRQLERLFQEYIGVSPKKQQISCGFRMYGGRCVIYLGRRRICRILFSRMVTVTSPILSIISKNMQEEPHLKPWSMQAEECRNFAIQSVSTLLD